MVLECGLWYSVHTLLTALLHICNTAVESIQYCTRDNKTALGMIIQQ